MRRALKRIWHGIPGHAGTMWIIALPLMGAVAGYSRAETIGSALGGAALMLVLFGPLYLYGAHERGRANGA